MNTGSLDFVTAIFSHELVEACTDPEGDAFQIAPANPNNWNEIGDRCEGDFLHKLLAFTGVIDGIRVQPYWSQRDQDCVIPPSEVRGHLIHDTAIKEQPNHTSAALDHAPAGGEVVVIHWQIKTNGELWQRVRWRATEGWVLASNVAIP
jgi:hypothetical protein